MINFKMNKQRNRHQNVMGFDPYEVPFGKGNACENVKQTDSKTINLQGIAARVDRVTVEGLSRTKDDIVSMAVKDLFDANNFEEVIKKSHRVRQNLQRLGCFRNIAIQIDTSAGPDSTPNGYEVKYEVNELKRVSGGVTTHVSNNAGILTVGGFFPNMFGRGESLRGEVSYGSNKSNTTNITFMKPFVSANNLVGELSAFQGQSDFPASGYNIVENGLIADLGFIFRSRWKNKIQYEANWRRLGAGTRQSSFFIRDKAGSTLKSSIHYRGTLDTRDSPVLPTCGNLVQLKTELAGLGGNVKYFKKELNLQTNIPFLNDCVLQCGLNMGVLVPLSDEEVSVADNFFLGGPLTFRGFDGRSVGPKADDNFVGATNYWATALHFYSPLPFRPASGGIGDLFRLHLFTNIGNIGQFDISNGIGKFFETQKDELRIAIGLGIAVKLGTMARAELNYCFPIKSKDSDGTVDGVQFGIGVEFL